MTAKPEIQPDKPEVLPWWKGRVPDNWVDPMLNGKDDVRCKILAAVIGMPPYTCRDIERVLDAVRDRIAVHAPEQDALLQQLRELAAEMLNARAHTYASENADRYRAWDDSAHYWGNRVSAILSGSKAAK